MSSYNQQEYDFISRTQKIIEQYDKINIPTKYEVTLLLNCFVGLLILPQQMWFNDLPNNPISEKEWGISDKHIGIIKQGEDKTVANIVRHLRNSVAHYSFIAFNNQSEEISRIKFEDYDANNLRVFQATIPIRNIRIFLNNFSDFMSKKIKDSK